MVKNDQNGQKWSKSPKMVKIAKNGQNCKNGQKWSKMVKKMVEIAKNCQNCEKWSKWSKMVQNGEKDEVKRLEGPPARSWGPEDP